MTEAKSSRVKIVKKEKRLTFSERLEQRARNLVESESEAGWESFPARRIKLEIAATLHHLEEQDRLEVFLNRHVCRAKLGSAIMNANAADQNGSGDSASQCTA